MNVYMSAHTLYAHVMPMTDNTYIILFVINCYIHV